MRAMGGRPMLLQRFPDGAGGSVVLPEAGARSIAPDWLADDGRRARRTARRREALVAADLAHVALGGEPRLPRLPRVAVPGRRSRARRRAAHRPRPAAGHRLRRGARGGAPRCKALLDELGVVGYPKTTGNRGLHVYVRLEPRWDSYEVRVAAVAVARELERRRPDLITAAWWKEERGERVFVDFNQNAPHKTVFGAWSVRAAAGRAGVDAVRVGRARQRSTPTSSTIATVPDARRGRRRPVGATSTTTRSRSSRCSRCTSATVPPGCRTRRGRPSTRRSPTSRPASPPAAPRRPDQKGCQGSIRSTSHASGGAFRSSSESTSGSAGQSIPSSGSA